MGSNRPKTGLTPEEKRTAYFFSKSQVFEDINGLTVIMLKHSLYLKWIRQVNDLPTPVKKARVSKSKGAKSKS